MNNKPQGMDRRDLLKTAVGIGLVVTAGTLANPVAAHAGESIRGDPQGNLKVDEESMVVLYDRRTGQIVHSHHVVTVKGGKHPDRKSLEAEAQEHASKTRGTLGSVGVLHVDPRQLKIDMEYKVDPAKGALVETPRILGKRRQSVE